MWVAVVPMATEEVEMSCLPLKLIFLKLEKFFIVFPLPLAIYDLHYINQTERDCQVMMPGIKISFKDLTLLCYFDNYWPSGFWLTKLERAPQH